MARRTFVSDLAGKMSVATANLLKRCAKSTSEGMAKTAAGLNKATVSAVSGLKTFKQGLNLQTASCYATLGSTGAWVISSLQGTDDQIKNDLGKALKLLNDNKASVQAVREDVGGVREAVVEVREAIEAQNKIQIARTIVIVAAVFLALQMVKKE